MKHNSTIQHLPPQPKHAPKCQHLPAIQRSVLRPAGSTFIIRYSIFFFLLLPLFSFSQKVSNVRFEQTGKQIHIFYDLEGKRSYNVKVYCSTDDGQTWGQPLQKVSGAAGENQQPGNNKEIIWDVLAEREKLTGEIRFKIEAGKPINIEMVFVKGGTFRMGSNDGGDYQKPVHTVRVDDFYIGKYEITQKQWREIMGNNPSYFKNCDDCPVEKVSWNDVQEFIKKLNAKTGLHYHLPTEAEWEYAAWGGNRSRGYKYAGSNNIDNVGWYDGNSGGKTHPVGTKQPNELGIYDMSGNVWEWCHDRYDASYYSSSPQNNPQGPASGKYRILRGGSWNLYRAFNCRVAHRLWYNPGSTNYGNGFRVAR